MILSELMAGNFVAKLSRFIDEGKIVGGD